MNNWLYYKTGNASKASINLRNPQSLDILRRFAFENA